MQVFKLVILVVVLLFLVGCSAFHAPEEYRLLSIPDTIYVKSGTARQEGGNLSCLDRYQKGILVAHDCAKTESFMQSVAGASLDGAVGAAVRRTDDYDDDTSVTIEAPKNSRKKHEKKRKKRKRKHY